MKRRRGGSWALLTFLDLITCGLGAAVLLLLIAATAQPTDPRFARDRTLLVLVRPYNTVALKAEVGLRYRRLGASSWRLLEPADGLMASIHQPRGTGVLACAALTRLDSGEYEFQPYLRALPVPGTPDTAGSPSVCRVRVECIGQGAVILTNQENVPALARPGDYGQIVRVSLRR